MTLKSVRSQNMEHLCLRQCPPLLNQVTAYQSMRKIIRRSENISCKDLREILGSQEMPVGLAAKLMKITKPDNAALLLRGMPVARAAMILGQKEIPFRTAIRILWNNEMPFETAAAILGDRKMPEDTAIGIVKSGYQMEANNENSLFPAAMKKILYHSAITDRRRGIILSTMPEFPFLLRRALSCESERDFIIASGISFGGLEKLLGSKEMPIDKAAKLMKEYIAYNKGRYYPTYYYCSMEHVPLARAVAIFNSPEMPLESIVRNDIINTPSGCSDSMLLSHPAVSLPKVAKIITMINPHTAAFLLQRIPVDRAAIILGQKEIAFMTAIRILWNKSMPFKAAAAILGSRKMPVYTAMEIIKSGYQMEVYDEKSLFPAAMAKILASSAMPLKKRQSILELMAGFYKRHGINLESNIDQ